MRTKCIIFGEAIRIRVKNFKQTLGENYLKSTKIAITSCKFAKILRGSMPPVPLELFLSLNQLQISSAEKSTLEKYVKIMPTTLFNFFAVQLPTLVVGQENFVIGFGPLYFRNASATAGHTGNKTLSIPAVSSFSVCPKP